MSEYTDIYGNQSSPQGDDVSDAAEAIQATNVAQKIANKSMLS